MPEILFPALTGLTLVFAGVLVGYFLWFKDRSEQILLREQLSVDNERMNAELSSHTAMINEIKDRNTRLDQKNMSMQQLCDDLLGSREKVQLQVTDLETELTAARTKLDRAREQITEESRSRAKLEEVQHQLKQKYLDSVSNVEGSWKERFTETNNSLTQNKSEVVRLMQLNDQLAEKLHSSNAETAKLKSELDAQREILDTAKSNAAGLEKEYVSLESSVRSQIELVNEARGKAAAAISAQKLAEDANSASQRQIEELKQQVLDLQSTVAENENLRSRCEHLENSLSTSSERMAVVVEQRDSSMVKQQELTREISSLKSRTENQSTSLTQLRADAEIAEQKRLKDESELYAQIQQLESNREKLQQERQRLGERLAIAEKRHEQQRAELTAQIEKLQSSNQELDRQRVQFTQRISSIEQTGLQAQQDLSGRLGKFESTNAQLKLDCGRLQELLSETESQRDRTQEELVRSSQQFETTSAQLTGEIERLTQQLQAFESNEASERSNQDALLLQIQQLEAANQTLMAEVTRLTEQIDSYSELEQVDQQALISTDEYRNRIDSVLEQRDGAYHDVQELKAEIKRLRQHSKTNEETIRVLRRERGAILLRNRASAVTTSFPRLHDESVDYSQGDQLASEYGGTTKLDPVRGHVFVEAPRRHDDLKLIHGVAQVLERKLNGFGIYTFKQIMEWDETAINEFSELLVFKDRIHRDDWQGQAASFYYRKNRSEAA